MVDNIWYIGSPMKGMFSNINLCLGISADMVLGSAGNLSPRALVKKNYINIWTFIVNYFYKFL